MIREKKIVDSIDSPETTLKHRELILNKPFLKLLYTDWYNQFKQYVNYKDGDIILEIGSGGGFLKDIFPEVITSDILELPVCDKCFPAENIPYDDDSVKAIFMLNVLHHIPDTPKFFEEAERVLKKGGILYMIEPSNTLISRFFNQKIHYEPFDPKAKEWTFPSNGPLSSANGALPWIIFKRDIAKFETMFPQLKLKEIKLHTPIRYILSGGLSFKTPFGARSFKPITFIEKIFTPLYPLTALFQTIIVEKK